MISLTWVVREYFYMDCTNLVVQREVSVVSFHYSLHHFDNNSDIFEFVYFSAL